MNETDVRADPPPPRDPAVAGGAAAQALRALNAQLPTQLRNLREQRYQGEDFDAPLTALTPGDQERIRLLYAYAKGVHGRWLTMRDAPDWAALRQLIVALLSPPLSTASSELGRETMAQRAPGPQTEALAKVLHDLRGGALMSLQLYAQMAEWDPDPAHLRSAAFLARDQAKIMRNALPALDPEVRRADEAEKPHAMQTVVDKWDGFRFTGPGGQAGRVEVACGYDGLLASCCLEASAVDRIVYNYVNNAIRFCAGSVIRLEMLAVGAHTVRWIVANPVTPDQAAWLHRATGGDLSQLFRGGLTRGGQGIGLSNCADFVAAAFGLPSIDAALDGRYLGARVEAGWYVAWAHWPSLYAPATAPDGVA